MEEHNSVIDDALRCNISTLNSTLEELLLLNVIKAKLNVKQKRICYAYGKIRMDGRNNDYKTIYTRYR